MTDAPNYSMVLPSTMRAVLQTRYGPPESLTVGRAPVPEPGPTQVLMRVRAAGISRGTIHLLTGLPRAARLALGIRAPRRHVPGLDAAGDVVAIGRKVTRFQLGQRVFGITTGALAEYAVADEGAIALAPQRMDDAHAAVIAESGLTAQQGLDAARVESGTRLLIIGASGGVGSFAVSMAASRGANVTAVCSTAKSATVLDWGAHRVIDYQKQDFMADRNSYDAILDIAGGTPLSQIRGALTATGSAVFIGNETGGTWTGGFEKPFLNALRMTATRQRYTVLIARNRYPDVERLAEEIERGHIVPHLHRCYRLESAPAALHELKSGAVSGKIAVTVYNG